MKRLLSVMVIMLLSTCAYAQNLMGISFDQATITEDVITLTCEGKVLMSVKGNAGKMMSYGAVAAILGNVNRSKCAVSVSGYDKNENPITVDGGTISIILDTAKQIVIYADDANFIPIRGLYDGGGREIKATFAVYAPHYDVWLNDHTIDGSSE